MNFHTITHITWTDFTTALLHCIQITVPRFVFMPRMTRYRMKSDSSSSYVGIRGYLYVLNNIYRYQCVYAGNVAIYVCICLYVCISRYVPAQPRRRRQARLGPPLRPPPPSLPPVDGPGRLHLGPSGDGRLCHWIQSQSHRFLEGALPAADRSSPPPSPQGGNRRTIHWAWHCPHSDRTLSGQFLP